MKDELSKKLSRNRHLARHLAELGRLLKREVLPEHLLSLDATEALLARSRATRRTPDWKQSVPFGDKNNGHLGWANEFKSDPVYLWTALTNICGAHPPVRLSEIDFGFSFNLCPEGILEVLSVDLENRMLLDWYEEGGAELLDLEVTGSRWGAAMP